MIKILFICHGNICRSPMAEFVLKDMAKKAGVGEHFLIDSAAASREELGNPIYGPAQRELTKHGILGASHRARQITAADLTKYDHIYYMDSRNYTYLHRMFPDFTDFRQFLPYDVADPWYSGDFTQTWEDIETGCRKILEELLCLTEKN